MIIGKKDTSVGQITIQRAPNVPTSAIEAEPTIANQTRPGKLPTKLPTPIKVAQLDARLVGYKDREFITNGFTYGFSLNYAGRQFSQSCNNSLSVNQNKDIA